jgi:hypothetical protein
LSADVPRHGPAGHLDPLNAKKAWFRRNWKAILAGVGAFIIGAIAGASGGGSTTAAPTVTETVTQTTVETVTNTKTVRAARPKPPPPPRAASVRRFSGNGGKTLPPMTLTNDKTLVWTATGGIFQIFEDNLGVPVNSQASHGETFVPAGTYTFQVNAIGDWTIEFR